MNGLYLAASGAAAQMSRLNAVTGNLANASTRVPPAARSDAGGGAARVLGSVRGA
jgi:flagellar basal body rod protein FlgC